MKTNCNIDGDCYRLYIENVMFHFFILGVSLPIFESYQEGSDSKSFRL